MSHTFEHKGKKITLPAFKDLPVGVIRKARKEDGEDIMWFILESILDEKQLELVDSMSLEQFNEAMKGWTQGAPVGESLQSSN
jgi:hypothetical protein